MRKKERLKKEFKRRWAIVSQDYSAQFLLDLEYRELVRPSVLKELGLSRYGFPLLARLKGSKTARRRRGRILRQLRNVGVNRSKTNTPDVQD